MPVQEVTTINSLGFLFVAVMSLLTLILPRRLALAPLLASVSYITLGQQVVVANLNFTALRLVLLAGWVRLLVRGELNGLRWGILDKVLVLWVVVGLSAYIGLRLSTDALINQLGFAYNVLGVFFLCRFLVRTIEEMRLAVKMLVVLSIPLAIALLLERVTTYNLFAVFGGVEFQSTVRDGAIRAQGPFRHPILAGTFGASLVPLALSLWFPAGKVRFLSVAGAISGTAIMLVSGSSGPLLSYVAGVTGIMLWKFHANRRYFLWGSLGSLVIMHLLMGAPVWHLMTRLSAMVGGTGWHRSFLIDQAINHFHEWWLMGTTRTAHWGAGGALTVLPNEPDMVDITSQYVLVAINGGIVSLALFSAIIVLAFRAVGQPLTVRKNLSIPDRFFIWGCGVVLLVHCLSFFSVSYFDQLIVIWYVLLAFVATFKTALSLSISQDPQKR